MLKVQMVNALTFQPLPKIVKVIIIKSTSNDRIIIILPDSMQSKMKILTRTMYL